MALILGAIRCTLTIASCVLGMNGKKCRRKKRWVTRGVLDLYDERMDLKKRRYEEEGAKEYRKTN